MANGCCVFGCNFKYNKRKICGKDDVSLHSFPKRNKDQRNAWIRAVRRVNWQPTNRSVVCSQHFRPEDMDLTGQTRRLREGVVPSIFPSYPKHLQKKTPSRKPPKPRAFQLPESTISPSPILNNFAKKCNSGIASETLISSSELTPLLALRSTSSPIKSDTDDCSDCSTSILSELSTSEDISVCDFTAVNSQALTPRKIKLMCQLEDKDNDLCSARRKIKILQQKVRRQSKKIQRDQEIIACLVKRQLSQNLQHTF